MGLFRRRPCEQLDIEVCATTADALKKQQRCNRKLGWMLKVYVLPLFGAAIDEVDWAGISSSASSAGSAQRKNLAEETCNFSSRANTARARSNQVTWQSFGPYFAVSTIAVSCKNGFVFNPFHPDCKTDFSYFFLKQIFRFIFKFVRFQRNCQIRFTSWSEWRTIEGTLSSRKTH